MFIRATTLDAFSLTQLLPAQLRAGRTPESQSPFFIGSRAILNDLGFR
jgi:hypothetical protein